VKINRECSVDGCQKSFYCKGYCHSHYDRMRRYGALTPARSYRSPKTPITYLWMQENSVVDKKTGCIEWGKYRDTNNYGMVAYRGRLRKASRVAWELVNGPIDIGMCVLHHCDNPPCINIDHLWVGTHAQNMADCKAKDRHTPGERNGYAKLTNCSVFQIRLLIENQTFTQTHIAKMFGVGDAEISRIKHRTRWAHI